MVAADQSWVETCLLESMRIRETEIRAWSLDPLQWRGFRAYLVESFAADIGIRAETQRLQTSYLNT